MSDLWDAIARPGVRKTASSETIYRGVKVILPKDVRTQIDSLANPDMDVSWYDSIAKIGPILLHWLETNTDHWDDRMKLGRHWSTRREMAEAAAQQGGAYGGIGIILEATYDEAGVDPDMSYTTKWSHESESEVTLLPGAKVMITGVYLYNYGIGDRENLLKTPICSTAMAVPDFKGRDRNMSKPQVLAACQRILKDIARQFGYTGPLPDIDITPYLPDDIEGQWMSSAGPNGVIALNEQLWLPNAIDKEFGYDHFRIFAHEAVHALIQKGEVTWHGFPQMITEGGAEILAVAYWAQHAPAYDDRDAYYQPGEPKGKWVAGDIALVQRMNYKDWVAELMLRAGGKCNWDVPRMLAEIQKAMAGNHIVRLEFRDTTDPASRPPSGVGADADSLMLWLIGQLVRQPRRDSKTAERMSIDDYFDGGVDQIEDTPWRRDGIHITMAPTDWAGMPVADVSLHGLQRTQKFLARKYISPKQRSADVGEDYPWAVFYQGQWWILDGHHRVVEAIEQGKTSLPMHTMRLTAKTAAPSLENVIGGLYVDEPKTAASDATWYHWSATGTLAPGWVHAGTRQSASERRDAFSESMNGGAADGVDGSPRMLQLTLSGPRLNSMSTPVHDRMIDALVNGGSITQELWHQNWKYMLPRASAASDVEMWLANMDAVAAKLRSGQRGAIFYVNDAEDVGSISVVAPRDCWTIGKTAARSYETGRWFHGTNAKLSPGEQIVPGLGAQHGDENDRVWVASNAWIASSYGSITYEVTPASPPKKRSKAGEFYCTMATVLRTVSNDEIRIAGNEWYAKYGAKTAAGAPIYRALRSVMIDYDPDAEGYLSGKEVLDRALVGLRAEGYGPEKPGSWWFVPPGRPGELEGAKFWANSFSKYQGARGDRAIVGFIYEAQFAEHQQGMPTTYIPGVPINITAIHVTNSDNQWERIPFTMVTTAGADVTFNSVSDESSRWDYYTEQWPSVRGQTTRTKQVGAYTMHLEEAVDDEGDWMIHVTLGERVVADLFFGFLDGRLKGAVQVDPQHRRHGIATAMYQWAEEIAGAEITPDIPHSPLAEAFWSQPDRPFGRSAALTGRKLWWRYHPVGREFMPEAASSVAIHNWDGDAPAQGFSAMRNPWHLFMYAANLGWGNEQSGVQGIWNTDVIGFTGKIIGQGSDREALIMPDMNIVLRYSWDEFVDELIDTPFPAGPYPSFYLSDEDPGRGSWSDLAKSLVTSEGVTWTRRDHMAPVVMHIIHAFAPVAMT